LSYLDIADFRRRGLAHAAYKPEEIAWHLNWQLQKAGNYSRLWQ